MRRRKVKIKGGDDPPLTNPWKIPFTGTAPEPEALLNFLLIK